MFKLVSITGIVLLAAGTCGKEPEANAPPATASQTAEQAGPQKGSMGEIENINEHLGDLKEDVQKKADDRTKAIDDKIQRGTQ